MHKLIQTAFKKPLVLFAVIVGVYLITHLPALTALPVFADETIYIRWSQLLISDPKQYFFFALNDGKTPLFIWMLVPFELFFSDPVYAARFLSVLAGLAQIFFSWMLVTTLGGKKRAQLFTVLAITFLPYWYFHHRIGLMDAWLTVWGTAAATFFIKSITKKKHSFLYAATAAVFSACAFITKVPAVLLLPAFFPFLFIENIKSWKRSLSNFKNISVFGAVLIALLTPLLFVAGFPQLFSRGSDFLFSLSEFLSGSWLQSASSLPNYAWYFLSYCSSGFFLLCIYGLFISFKNKRPFILSLLSGLIFLAPIFLLGKVVYPRYLLPALPFFTVAAALVFEELLLRIDTLTTVVKRLSLASLLFLIVVTQFSVVSFEFMTRSLLAPDTIPFVAADRTQYLTEWSSGHGILETVRYIESQAQTKRVAVATEGYFGTLPDGILLYLFHKDVHNIWIEGIGQPVRGIPSSFAVKAQEFDQILLVVNSHRLLTTFPNGRLVSSYCRPYQAPCLQVWDITGEIKN
ncbi:glycosyltransferase family 39 protein [Candidatus Woesebacteria bacterium]|nr:glycosyltransferase family 39 protein [Candidatus Woesebacteria bacterium]